MEDRPEIFVYMTSQGEIVGPKMELVARSMYNLFDAAIANWMTIERMPVMIERGPNAGKMGMNIRASLHDSTIYLKSTNVHSYHLADQETTSMYFSTKDQVRMAKSGIMTPEEGMPTTPSGIIIPS